MFRVLICVVGSAERNVGEGWAGLMADPGERGGKATEGRLSIGALSRATGVPVERLRTWERRYGFPRPDRKPSGQRVYRAGLVERIRMISRAIREGLRPAEAVAASDPELRAYLGLVTGLPSVPAVEPASAVPPGDALPSLVEAVMGFDGRLLAGILESLRAEQDLLGYLEGTIAPFIAEVGRRWFEGALDIRHEHFLSERVGDLLRSARLSLEGRAEGAPVALATLPGELHGLGLQMAALVLAAQGLRTVILGASIPGSEIAAVARGQKARAVGISVSAYSAGGETNRMLLDLRDQLPPQTALIAGGDGAEQLPRVVVLKDLRSLALWASNDSPEQVAAGSGAATGNGVVSGNRPDRSRRG